MRDLEVTVGWDGTLCLLALRGEARLENLERLDGAVETLLEREAQHVILDMTHLEFMDSASTGSLLRLQGRMEERGGRVMLHGLRPVVMRLLERTGLESRLPMVADEAAARALLASD